MKIIPRNICTTSNFYLPIHPHCLIQSQCPVCGGPAFPDEDIRSANINFGSKKEPTKLSFTCFNQLPDKTDCDNTWEELVVILVSLEKAP